MIFLEMVLHQDCKDTPEFAWAVPSDVTLVVKHEIWPQVERDRARAA